ncbi:cytochrome C5 [Nocardia sp. NPDC058058]|uniref:cytochrome C5 n=1 Tax=Nocardia sp. NPDC058058 TaxID=3346317 RepID=UPI0036DA384A
MNPLDALMDEIARSGLLSSPQIGDGFIHGTARIPSAAVDVAVNVDPELDDYPTPDSTALVAAIRQLLTITPERWQLITDSIAREIEEAVADQLIVESTDLREDLTLTSSVVFHDAILLSFAAPKQFPDSWIRVQLDEDLLVDGVMVDDRDDDVETMEFDSVDNLLDHLGGIENR